MVVASSGGSSVLRIIVWVIVPVLHFHLWLHYGRKHRDCFHAKLETPSLEILQKNSATGVTNLGTPNHSHSHSHSHSKPSLSKAVPSSRCQRASRNSHSTPYNTSPPADYDYTLQADVIQSMDCSQSAFASQYNHILISHNILTYYDIKTPHLELRNAKEFDVIRGERLATVPYVDRKNTVIVKRDASEECTEYVYHTSGTVQSKFCFSIYRVAHKLSAHWTATNATHNLLRFDRHIDIATGDFITNLTEDPAEVEARMQQNVNLKQLHPTGFFREPPKKAGFKRIAEKMLPFLEHFDGPNGIDATLRTELAFHNIQPGDDVITMVVNEGEIDLFMNFACSCRLHNISLHHLIVFAGSSEILTVVESTGAMALYHPGYGSVSKKASYEYLDRIFVDMMWYKSFSIYLILRLGINVLFQDVDLVWFKDPFEYFYNFIKDTKQRSDMTGSHPEAFFSDDGQRSHRYTPFFANSGFFYLVASERSTYFAWSIMIAFDSIQVSGSHQNVFTMKLMEGLGLGYPEAKLLSLEEFPTGIMFHHNKKYLKKLYAHKVVPYNFHMCWTKGKADKLTNLRTAKMWYLAEECSPLEAMIPEGAIYDRIYARKEKYHKSVAMDHQLWAELAQTCCQAMPDAL